MKAKFALIALLLACSSAFAESICKNSDYTKAFIQSTEETATKMGLKSKTKCEGDTFYITYHIDDKDTFTQIRLNSQEVAKELKPACNFFDSSVEFVGANAKKQYTGNLIYIYEYKGQKIEFPCK